MVRLLWCPLQGQELDSMVLMCPFQLKDILFLYNFVTLAYLIASKPVPKWHRRACVPENMPCPVPTAAVRHSLSLGILWASDGKPLPGRVCADQELD